MEPDEELFMAAVRSGVMGYLLKDTSASELVATMHAIYQKETICPPQLCSTLFRFIPHIIEEMPVKRSGPRPDLTIHQQQLMVLMAKDFTNKEIASQLNLSKFTIRNHIHNILKQMDTNSRNKTVQ